VIAKSQGENEESDRSYGQTLDTGEVSDASSETELSVAENLAIVDTEKGKESARGAETESVVTICTNAKDNSVGTSGTQPDFLAIIWKSLQEDRERNERSRKEDERLRKEERERERKLDAEKWEKLTEKLSDRFTSEIDKINESILLRETGKFSQEKSALKTQLPNSFRSTI
jgi:hypothetical protein